MAKPNPRYKEMMEKKAEIEAMDISPEMKLFLKKAAGLSTDE